MIKHEEIKYRKKNYIKEQCVIHQPYSNEYPRHYQIILYIFCKQTMVRAGEDNSVTQPSLHKLPVIPEELRIPGQLSALYYPFLRKHLGQVS